MVDYTRVELEFLVGYAEPVGFEPTVGISHSGFQDQHHKPLGHGSIVGLALEATWRSFNVPLALSSTRARPGRTHHFSTKNCGDRGIRTPGGIPTQLFESCTISLSYISPWRSRQDSNLRGFYPNTLSKRAP